ncbi:hypothetical protein JTB14_035864 [Gonioctena quinquepunctata]|nr:hypothetical protein JTB14_035864 [Gonioctena quinquepunctata]
MDVLVRWRDGTKNIVSSSELKITSRILKVGSKVKMLYKKKWYSGVVIDMEENVAAEWSPEDDVPLTNFSNVLKNSKTLQHNNIAGAETMTEREPIPEIEITDDFVVEAIDAEEQNEVNGEKPSIITYRNILRSKNVSFHKPKKDQCFLCITFKDGDDNTKLKPKDIYDKHNAEKIKVRELKNECKTRATIDKKFVCGSFDLQQVLHLPVSNESAIFHKRRLCNYNLTYYDIVTKACKCYTWHEGDLFVPAQLHTIFKLARRQRPYEVFPLGFEDFIDFKKLSLDLRIIKSRETDDAIKWNDIMEVKVSKLHPDTLFFKSSHNQQKYSKITLKRQKKINLKTVILRPLNEEPNKIGKAKYKDLISLCQGVTPVVKIAEYRDFYASLPHTDN